MKKYSILIVSVIFALQALSCSDDSVGISTGGTDAGPVLDVFDPGDDMSEGDASDALTDALKEEDIGEPEYHDDCFRAEYYFCPPLDAIWKIEVIVNICTEPPEIVSKGECEQYFECDPSDDTVVKKSCTDPNGLHGYQDKWCEKGKFVLSECVPCLEEVCNDSDDDCDGFVDEDIPIDSCVNQCGPGDLLCINGESVCVGDVPQEEVCDFLDNDCDGEVDEDVRNVCDDCGVVPPEICDGIDNDCDGSVDDNIISPLCENECGIGDLLCIDGKETCVGKVPLEEVCNNLDDDCDGIVDEGDWECESICGVGPLLCIAGVEVCNAPEPSEEICDYLDNDCDGEIDEGQRNECDECGPVPDDVCNGKDDDCDGDIDEGLIDVCETDCGSDVSYCLNGEWTCTAPQPSPEICDMLDNDCDGEIDEGIDCKCAWFGVMLPCEKSPLICGSGYQTCVCTKYELNCVGDEVCVASEISECTSHCWALGTKGPDCHKNVGEPVDEMCNNWDDDCDSKVDEYLEKECYTGPEETLDVGICHAGEIMCYKGKWGHSDSQGMANFVPGYCKDQQLPKSKDSCDGIDGDCDGIIDDGKEMEDTDILFIIDASGSMELEMKGVMGALETFSTYYSDEEVIQWGIVSGPMLGTTCAVFDLKKDCFNYDEYLLLYSSLNPFTQFISDLAVLKSIISTSGSGAEMLYDALFLSIYDLSPFAPWDKNMLSWSNMNGVPIFSVPDIDQFTIDWREDAHHVIIVFTDEPGDSYLYPKIMMNDLTNMLPTADDVTVYTFTSSSSSIKSTWEPVASAGGGKWYPLPPVPGPIYESLMEILDETACGDTGE